MKLAILGTGTVGRTFVQALAPQVDRVAWGTRSPEETARRTLESGNQGTIGAWLGNYPSVRLVRYEECGDADLFLNLTNGEASLSAIESVGEANLVGKTLVDVANPLDFSRGFPPSLFISNTDSLAESIQRRFPQTKVVKALNTMTASVMVDPASVAQGDHHLFVCGNSPEAKEQVKTLLSHWFGWKRILDLGDLSAARATEMLLPLWLRIWQATGHAQFQIKVMGLE